MERKRYILNQKRIEIDITYNCNLSCINCNRSCGHNNIKEYMTIEQIQKFINESINQNKQWESIRVLGGEPTLHPNFKEIIINIKQYIDEYNTKCTLEIVSNGSTERIKNKLKEVESFCSIVDTDKTSNEQPFDLFNIAPIDTKEHKSNDYTKGCWITEGCGFGLNMYGYYPCGCGASIDTFINKDIGRKEIPIDNMDKELNELCRYCGHFNNGGAFNEWWNKKQETEVDYTISYTWQKLYDKGNKPLAKY